MHLGLHHFLDRVLIRNTCIWKLLFTIWWCCAPAWHLNGMLQEETKTIRPSEPHQTMLMIFRSVTSKRHIDMRNENHRLAPLPNTMLTIMAEECKHTCWEALRLLISLPCLHPCLLSQNRWGAGAMYLQHLWFGLTLQMWIVRISSFFIGGW